MYKTRDIMYSALTHFSERSLVRYAGSSSGAAAGGDATTAAGAHKRLLLPGRGGPLRGGPGVPRVAPRRPESATLGQSGAETRESID